MPRIKDPKTFHPTILEAEYSELDLQRYIQSQLEARGYIVHKIGGGRHTVSCPNCRQRFYPSGYQGNDKSAPDFQIGRLEWGNNWKVIEIKTLSGLKLDGTPKKGDIEEGQQDLVDWGVSAIARTLQQCIDILEKDPPITRSDRAGVAISALIEDFFS